MELNDTLELKLHIPREDVMAEIVKPLKVNSRGILEAAFEIAGKGLAEWGPEAPNRYLLSASIYGKDGFQGTYERWTAFRRVGQKTVKDGKMCIRDRAVVLTTNFLPRLSKVMKTVFTIPMMIAPIVIATIWKLMFSPIYGVLNGLLVSMGLDRVEWLSAVIPARIALIIVEVWATTCLLYTSRFFIPGGSCVPGRFPAIFTKRICMI